MLLAYSRAFTGEFLRWDDVINVRDNPRFNPVTVESLLKYWPPLLGRDDLDNQTGRPFDPGQRVHINHAFGLYIPMTYTVWGGVAVMAQTQTSPLNTDRSATELNPWVFHATNVLLHAGSAVLVYLILKMLVQSEFACAAGAMVFALHPVQVESVAWIAGMKDVLAGMLGLAAILLHLRANGRARHFFAFLLALGSMLSKPSAVMLPVVALLIDVLGNRRSIRSSLLSLAPWFAIAVPVAIIARLAQPAIGVTPSPIWARPLIVGDSLAFYLGKLVLPINLCIDYGRTPQRVIDSGAIWWMWTIPTAVLICCILVRRWSRLPLLGLCVFAAALLPTLGITTFLFQYYSTTADHYLYLSMLGTAIVVASMAQWKPARPLVAAVILPLMALTIWSAAFWRDDLALFTRAISVNPRSAPAHNNLGTVLLDQGQPTAAEAHFRMAVELNPQYLASLDNLARVTEVKGNFVESARCVEKMIDVRSALPRSIVGDLVPDHIRAYTLWRKAGKPDLAEPHYLFVKKTDPHNRELQRLGIDYPRPLSPLPVR